jgi:hypothetical protein
VKNKVKIYLIILYTVIFCGGVALSNEKDRIEKIGEPIAHPVLIDIAIPSSGLMKKSAGRVHFLKDVTGIYVEIGNDVQAVWVGNVIKMDRDSIVNLYFDDGSIVTLGPETEVKWFRFTQGQ